jgi:thymidylate kinase
VSPCVAADRIEHVQNELSQPSKKAVVVSGGTSTVHWLIRAARIDFDWIGCNSLALKPDLALFID